MCPISLVHWFDGGHTRLECTNSPCIARTIRFISLFSPHKHKNKHGFSTNKNSLVLQLEAAGFVRFWVFINQILPGDQQKRSSPNIPNYIGSTSRQVSFWPQKIRLSCDLCDLTTILLVCSCCSCINPNSREEPSWLSTVPGAYWDFSNATPIGSCHPLWPSEMTPTHDHLSTYRSNGGILLRSHINLIWNMNDKNSYSCAPIFQAKGTVTCWQIEDTFRVAITHLYSMFPCQSCEKKHHMKENENQYI